MRQSIEDKHSQISVKHMEAKFKSKKRSHEDVFKAKTVGMVSLEEYRKAKSGLLKAQAIAMGKKTKKKKKKKKKKKLTKLSFAMDDEEEEETNALLSPDSSQKKKVIGTFGKNPNVTTDFLPDRDRDKQSNELRRKYTKEYNVIQEGIKEEKLEVTYSYWDGSGHRRDIIVAKGTTIGRFLEQVRLDLMNEFPELRGVSAENLIYVKEDLLIPQHYSFYDLIVTKARGKSGPLFHFDVHDDIRITNDSRVEKDESHPGKIVERRWFERNKHIFPASRWEMYDPAVKRDSYSIHGNEVRGEGAKKGADGEPECVALAGIWSVGANL